MALGLHFPDTVSGRVFSQSATPLGLAIPIYTATAIAGGMPIWNPPNSGVYVELVSVDVVFSSTLAAFGAIGLMAGQVTSIGTSTGCSAFASTVPVNRATMLATGGSKVQSSNAGTVTVTAGTAGAATPGVAGAGWVQALYNFNLENNVGVAHGTIGPSTYWFNGTVFVPEGVMVYLAASQATGGLYATSVVWKEIPKVR